MREGDVLYAARAAERFALAENPGGDQTERKRRHGQIVPAKAERDEAENEPEQRREPRPKRGTEHELQPGRDERGPGYRRREIAERVGADAEKTRLADRNLRDVAQENREPDRRDRIDRGVRARL